MKALLTRLSGVRLTLRFAKMLLLQQRAERERRFRFRLV